MTTILDIVENWDEISTRVLNAIGTDRLQDEVQRALNAGAEPPLEWVGSGATGSVFCDSQGFAYKVAHYETDHSKNIFQREFEWLEEAFSLDLPVAEPVELDLDELVLVRSCPVGRPGSWSDSRKLQDIHFDLIQPTMKEAGWTIPEYKDDSYVIDNEDGPVLVDASAPLRIGKAMLAYAREILAGDRETYEESPADVASELETEILMERVDPDEAQPLIDALNQLETA